MIGTFLVSSLIFSSGNQGAQRHTALALFKQTGLEKEVQLTVRTMVNKDWEKPAAYLYQANEIVLNKRITLSFSF